jgi:hypothetical protein
MDMANESKQTEERIRTLQTENTEEAQMPSAEDVLKRNWH